MKKRENHLEDRDMLHRQPRTPRMRRIHVTARLIAIMIVLVIWFALLSDYAIVMQSVLKEKSLVSEQRLPSTGISEEAYKPLGDGKSKVLEHEPIHLLGGAEDEKGTLRGGESKVPKQEEERGLVPEEVHQGGESEQSGSTHFGNKTICFITSVFGTSVEKADKLPNVENSFPNDTASDYDFLLFTNLENLTSPGWTNIVIMDLPYRRFITQSRWGKFLGWRHKGLSHCGTVIYMDGYVKPQTANGLAPFREVAAQVAQSEVGLAQVTHPLNRRMRNLEKILKEIVKTKKDVPANVNATMQWLREQPDFDNKCTYYLNKWFAYDPSNPRFREVASFFWDRYSQELDSWRDQPLWSYSLHHFNMKPVVLYEWGTRKDLFIENLETRGFGGHVHDEKDDKDAYEFRKKQAEKLLASQ